MFSDLPYIYGFFSVWLWVRRGVEKEKKGERKAAGTWHFCDWICRWVNIL